MAEVTMDELRDSIGNYFIIRGQLLKLQEEIGVLNNKVNQDKQEVSRLQIIESRIGDNNKKLTDMRKEEKAKEEELNKLLKFLKDNNVSLPSINDNPGTKKTRL